MQITRAHAVLHIMIPRIIAMVRSPVIADNEVGEVRWCMSREYKVF